MGINIVGTGMYLPELEVDNQAFTKLVDTSDEWITTRTGIKKRYFTNGELAYQIGAKAAKQALDHAGVSAEEIDMILVSSCSQDFFTPSIACMIGKEIGAATAPGMDLNAACAGFVFALDVAEKYLHSGLKRILIVAAEVLSRMIDFEDRATCVLFGDGAAAAVVTAGEGLYASFLAGKPEGAEKIFAKLPAPTHPFSNKQAVYDDPLMDDMPDFHLFMAGNDVYKFATVAMPEAILAAAEKSGIPVQELDWIIPHQANIRIIQTAMKKLGVSEQKCYINIDHCGNISSACIPLALTQLCEQGRLKKGQKIALVGFGAGLVYAATIFEW